MKESDIDSISTKLINNEPVLIETKWSNYKIIIKLDKNNDFVLRLAKVTSSNKSSHFEELEDIEISNLWCNDLKTILTNLQNNGEFIDSIIVKKIEDEKVLNLSNTPLKTKDKKSDKSKKI